MLLALLVLAACAAPVPVSKGEPRFQERTIRLHEDGAMQKGLLTTPVYIDGIPCTSWVRFHDNGGLDDFELADDHEFSGRLIPMGSRVFLDESGVMKSVWLAHDMIIDSIPVKGGWGKIATAFHPSGRLRAVFLYENAVIQGVECKASLLRPVYFDANGMLLGDNME
jgi:hypothetical protein